MKKIAVVPTLLTLGNGVCGFVAITWASKIVTPGDSAFNIMTPGNSVLTVTQDRASVDLYFAAAGWFLIFAMIFDTLDGYVARLSKTASKFGAELDSLCDAISFGVAPAFLLLKMGPSWERAFYHHVLAGIATLFMACAILRLARFNVDLTQDTSTNKRFRGLPSPGAAGCIASLAILRGELPRDLAIFWPGVDYYDHVALFTEVAAPIVALLAGLLMVSVVPYPHITKQVLRGRRTLSHLIQVLLAGLVVLLVREVALVVIFWGYALLFPLRGLAVRAPAPTDEPPRPPA